MLTQNVTEPEIVQADLLNAHFGKLVDKASNYLDSASMKQLTDAYLFGRSAHNLQLRKSGEPYFLHPIAVAELLADMQLDVETLITALLHDTVEDCDVTSEDIYTHFGYKIAELVNGVTKLSQIEIQSFDTKQAENFRKFMLAISRDVRVLVVKLADRTHNMRTIGALAHKKQAKIAKETMDIFAPLADRMGISFFQQELEDLCFNVLEPEMRQSILSALDNLPAAEKDVLENIAQELRELITHQNINCTVEWRLKTPYSISQKMKRKALSFEQLSDVTAFRIITPSIGDCYTAMGIIHQRYPTIIGKFKDYMSAPKKNGYRSIHTSVFGPFNQKIEIQIRTEEMHEVAEKGVASHWVYNNTKFPKKAAEDNLEPNQPADAVPKDMDMQSISWIRELTSLLEQNSGPVEFLEDTKLEMYRDQIFCFSPKGEIYNLPKGATALDFAYSVHSDLGDYCDHILVNGRRRQLSTILENGDQVRIVTSDKVAVKIEWESFVETGRARSHIRRVCRALKQQQFASLGKSVLSDEFRYRGLVLDEELLKYSLLSFNLTSLEQLYVLVGEGKELTKEMVLDKIQPSEKTKKTNKKSIPKPAFVLADEYAGTSVQLAKCCHPLPGDKIIGILNAGLGVVVHRKSCETAYKFSERPELWVEVVWPRTAEQRYSGRIKVLLLDEPGTLATMCTVISQHSGNIAFIQLEERNLNYYTFILDIEVVHLDHLNEIVSVLRSNRLIEQVERYSY